MRNTFLLTRANLARCSHLLSQIIDHREDHFHAEYGEREALIEIESLVVYAGSLPSRALALVRERAMLHRDELRQDWTLA